MSLIDAARQAWAELEAATARQREAEAIAERQRHAADLARMRTLAASTAAELLGRDELDDTHAWTADHPSQATLDIDGIMLRVTASWQRPSSTPHPFDIRLTALVPCLDGHLDEHTPDGPSRWKALPEQPEQGALARLGDVLANPPECATCYFFTSHTPAGAVE